LLSHETGCRDDELLVAAKMVFHIGLELKGNFFIQPGKLRVVVFELAHPLPGKPIAIEDIMATLLAGVCSHFLYDRIFKKHQAAWRRNEHPDRLRCICGEFAFYRNKQVQTVCCTCLLGGGL
jgi:hypothetical protein